MITGPSPRGWHRLQQAAECLQKYAWTYEDPAASKDSKSPALVKGSLVHLALAQHYARKRDGEEGWVEPVEAVELMAKVDKNTQYVPEVVKTYEEYVRRFEYEDRNWTVIKVEDLLEVQIAGKYRLTGRMDLVIEDLAGRIFVVDHKTTGRITSAHAQYYGVSGQLLGYAHMARHHFGERFAGLIVNLVQLGGERFDRIVLPRSPKLEAGFEQIVVDIEESIERMQAQGRHFADWPKAINEMTCYGRYGACNHIDKCRFGKGASTAGAWKWGG
jgi:hypothetical protein